MTAGINVTVSSTAAGVNVSGGTAATIAVSTGVGTAGTSVAITVSGGIGPAGFITAPGSATNAFGVFQLTAGNGITISTSAAQFQIASYGTASLGSYAPVQSVAGRTGTVTLVAGDITAGTFATARIPALSYTTLSNIPTSFAPSSHTHDASEVAAGTLSVARIPTISYTALSNVPTTFTPATHTHSQAQVLPAQAGYAGPLVTDGTTAAWTSRYSIVSPVIVQGSGMTISRDTAAGTISIAYAGGTSGLVVGTATPQQLGTPSAGSSANASREDHVHQLPTISYTALANVPTTFSPNTAIANVVSVNGITGTPTIVAGSNVTVTTAASSITISAAAGGTSGGGSFSWSSAPASVTATASAGSLAYDNAYIYVATASNFWRRAALSTWNGDSLFSNVTLLLHMDGSNGSTTFTDTSSYGRTITAYGGAAVSTAQSKWGGASLYCDGSGDYLKTASSSDFDWSAGDAVIEAWIRLSDMSVTRHLCGTTNATSDYKTGAYVASDGTIALSLIGTNSLSSSSGVITTNTWYHVAFVKSGSSAYIYVNGTRVASGTSSQCWSSGAAPFSIGRTYQPGGGGDGDWYGYIDDLRVTLGNNRGYTGSTITTPSSAFLDF
jgi:hypothetical protein